MVLLVLAVDMFLSVSGTQGPIPVRVGGRKNHGQNTADAVTSMMTKLTAQKWPAGA